MSSRSAAIGGIPLLNDLSSFGASFALLKEPRQDAVQRVDSLGEIEVRREHKMVVSRAFGSSPGTYLEALSDSLAIAQRGLDLMSMRGVDNLAITSGYAEHLAWWETLQGVTLRVVSETALRLDAPPVRGIVTDAAGKEKPSAPDPHASHPSFRFFRLSQVTDDAFDAFRNIYLALEALLSDLVPIKLKTNGKPDESERVWLERALGFVAQQVDLKTYAAPNSADPVADIIAEVYQATRAGVFHAKANRQVLMPHDAADRASVAAAIERAATLFVAIVDAYLGVRRISGGGTAGLFKLMTDPFRDAVLYVSDDPSPLDTSETVLNPGGGKLVATTMTAGGRELAPLKREWSGATPLSSCQDLPHICRLGLAMNDESQTPIAAATLEGSLTLGGLAMLECQMTVEMLNVRRVRRDYVL